MSSNSPKDHDDDAPRRRGPRPAGATTSRTPKAAPSEETAAASTREAILEAARESFFRVGFTSTTIRAVARAAGVDPALVSYYFGSKGGLFGACLNLKVRMREEITKVVADDIRTAGPRLVRLAMSAWDDGADGATFRTLLRWAATNEDAPAAVQHYATELVSGSLAEALTTSGPGGVDAREQATLASTQLVGLAMVRYVLRVEPVASASVDHLVAVVGPTIQHYLTGPLGDAKR